MTFDLVFMSWLLMGPVMLALWVVQRTYQNAVIADLGFCLGFGIIVLWYGLVVEGDPVRRWLVGSMGAVYAFRLGLHLFFNRVYKKTEDSRYQRLRSRWGNRDQFYFFLYFQGQAIAIAVFSLPLLVLMQNPAPTFSFWEAVGILVWMIAVGGEALADSQLTRFRTQSKNRGKTCREGLWRYSRHPNYFFEGLHWCSYVIMGIGIPYGWITLIGPVLMIWGLLKITGIPFSEAQALASRGEDYRNYQRTTSAFIPWFPKKF
jgi:steroid 5-alpha reductase family enzyme